jgi:hypothetical protein
MILSVSRRTDIPRFYFDWFLGRLAEKTVLVRNPMNFHQVSEIELSPEVVDCIVFWSKDPAPMLERLAELEPYTYYIQFTINPYGRELEQNLPLKEVLVDTFHRLSDAIGPRRMVWRYSPVLLNDTYTERWHLDAFEALAAKLKGHTDQCTLSFIDIYKKIKPKTTAHGIFTIADSVKFRMAQSFLKIAAHYQLSLRICGDTALHAAGFPVAKCIDGKRIAAIANKHFDLKKDRNQPPDCRCVSSIDIGAYNTCLNGCLYCYANHSSFTTTQRKHQTYDPTSPLLCSSLMPDDKVTKRIVRAEGSDQMKMF